MASSDPGVPQVRDALGTLHDGDTSRVLHVDDEPEFADLVSVYLERESDVIEVVTEHDADAALDRIRTEDIDCVVSDYDMPETDGLAFLEAVRADYPDLPFILFTGKGSEEIASEAVSTGVTDHLQKQSGTDQYAVLANRIENTTRRYRVEREVERGFRAIETAREGIAFLDEEGRFLYVNPAYAEVYGYGRDELVGEHWELLYPDEHVSQVYEEILPAVPREGRWTGESVHVCRDGERLVVDHALAYTDEGTLLCLIQDITETKELERELELGRRKFELFVDAVEEYAIFALDPEGFVTTWNRGAARLKGYDADEIVGEHFSTFYPDDRVEAGHPEGLLATALAQGTVRDWGPRVRADGSTFRADVTITAVFDDDGIHQGFLKVTEDVTDRHRDRRAREDDRDLLERALDVLQDVFYVLDAEGELVRVTDRAAEVTGYAREDLLSMAPPELFVPGDRERVRAEIETALDAGSAAVEADVLTADGRRIPYEFRKRRVVDDDGTVFVVGVGRDVSERKRRKRQLERQLAQFEHFGSVLSHDLRTPLNTAQGRLELARETGEDEHLRAAETALERLDDLVGDLASVMREGELVGDVAPVALADCLRSTWTSLDTDGATLHVDLGPGTTVMADEEALARLAENLFANALEHGGETVTVEVGDLPEGFYVADDGPGIPESERDRVFEAGYSTKDRTTGNANGHGFGLASVEQLVVAHGWEITVTDGPAGGARFEITDVDVRE